MAIARRQWLVPFLFILFFGVTAPRSASADPVQITNGFLSIKWDGCCAGFFIQGSGFSVSVADSFHINQFLPTLQAGTTVDPNYTANLGGRGGAVVDGVAVQNPRDPFTNLKYFGGALFFDTDPFLVEDRDPSATFVSFSTRFRMNGTIAGYSTFERTGPPLFNVSVIGQGVVDYRLLRRFEDDGRVTFATFSTNKIYTFDQLEAAPTPEPATMLLLGTGAGIIALRARRRRDHTT